MLLWDFVCAFHTDLASQYSNTFSICPLVLISTLHLYFQFSSDALTWKIPEIFCWLHKEGNLSEEEMTRTFNCGIGAVLVVKKELAQQVLKDIERHEAAWLIGKVVSLQKGYYIFIFLKEKNAELSSLAGESSWRLAEKLLIDTSMAFLHKVLK